jgi:hypothetical protein
MTDELQEAQEEQPQVDEVLDSGAEEATAEAEEDVEAGGAPDPDATEPADPGTEPEDISSEESEES